MTDNVIISLLSMQSCDDQTASVLLDWKNANYSRDLKEMWVDWLHAHRGQSG